MTWGFLDTRAGVTAAELAAFEAGAGIRFPPQYRAFLMRQNGGGPDRMIAPDPGVGRDVSCFFQLYRRDRSDPLPDLNGKIGQELLWIANDSGGGVYGIIHQGQRFGQIVWFDLPHSEVDWPKAEACLAVSDGFDMFFASLRPI